MVLQREWMAYSTLKPQASCSAEVAAALLMQTTWQANGCMWKLLKCVDGTLKVFCECETAWKATVIFTKAHSFHQYGLRPGSCFWCSTFFLSWRADKVNISIFILGFFFFIIHFSFNEGQQSTIEELGCQSCSLYIQHKQASVVRARPQTTSRACFWCSWHCLKYQ